MKKKSGNATMILLIIALVVGIASVILIIAVSRTNPQPITKAAAPLLPSANPLSTVSGQAQFTAPVPAGPTTVTTPAVTTTPGTITTTTLLSTDRTTLAVDFTTPSFTGINTVTYSITYTADVSGVPTTKNIQGSFQPATTLITGYQTNGSPYIRKTFTLGTCSGSACTYDTNPRNFTATATTQ